MTDTSQDFSAIRPYGDEEIRPALLRVIAERECLDLIGSFRFPRAYGYFAWLLRPLLYLYLRLQVSQLNSVERFQLVVKRYLAKLLKTTCSDLQVTGLDGLDVSRPTLFISNHRDIALDAAFVGYVLHQRNSGTMRIAIGDNLLTKPFASDLMRANKSFIVPRAANGPRELLRGLKLLSAYIWHSLDVDREHVWIAQREGRAKDGVDVTEPAIIKMLSIAKPRDIAFSDYIRQLNIVPVSVSYEYDPCDQMKAREMRKRQESGDYEKEQHEDLLSIGTGIAGYKGKVRLHFCAPLTGDYEGAEAVAAALDEAIIGHYPLQGTNYLAYEILYGSVAMHEVHKGVLAAIGADERNRFLQRVADCPDEDTAQLLSAYANPLVSIERLGQASAGATTQEV